MQDGISKRTLMSVSAAGVLAAPLKSLLIRAAKADEAPSQSGDADKCVWTLTAPPGTNRKDFQQFVLRDLAKTAGQRLDGTTLVTVTLQELDQYSGASVGAGDDACPVDAVLQITSGKPYAPLKEVNAHLRANCGPIQGWRVHPTLIYDARIPVQLGEPSARPEILIFLERLDGTTPEHFSRNWYMHAGHLDGQEAENHQSRARREQREQTQSGGRYIQNRTLEPITPTDWVMHGYTQLMVQQFAPGEPDRYERHHGEDIFEEWPPWMVQGYVYRVV